MPKDIKKKLQNEKRRTYLAKDFDSFRADMLSYARTYFPDKIHDFSESSFGGLLLDFAATVGDNLSFYLDHQFNELNPFTAIEPNNVITHLRNAGVEVSTASPAVVDVNFSITVPFEEDAISLVRRPSRIALPIILSDTSLMSNSGIEFNLVDDVNFATEDRTGRLRDCSITIASVDSTGKPNSYILTKTGLCLSGQEVVESFSIPNVHKPFREITLANTNVTDIMYVVDSNSNNYYGVASLTDDVVFGGTPRPDIDGQLVAEDLEIIPAPRRYVKIVDPRSKLATLQFGGGKAESLKDDIIPDPSELALPLYGKKTFSRFVIDPNSLLDTRTLGVAPLNTVITVKYRHGGGLSHNVNAGSINQINHLYIVFRSKSITGNLADQVRASLTYQNPQPAGGGLNPPTLDDLRAAIASTRNAQNRMVTRSDLYARIFTLPAKFGRVYRAKATNNPSNPLASRLYLISLDIDGNLTAVPDALQKNLRKYLNEFRLVSDAVDILNARVFNWGIKFGIVTHPTTNKQLVTQDVISRLKDVSGVENFQIGQPIIMSDIVNIIINTPGVLSIFEMPSIFSRFGTVEGRIYSTLDYNPDNYELRGMIIPPEGAIFEMRYPDFDIVGTAI